MSETDFWPSISAITVATRGLQGVPSGWETVFKTCPCTNSPSASTGFNWTCTPSASRGTAFNIWLRWGSAARAANHRVRDKRSDSTARTLSMNSSGAWPRSNTTRS